MKQDTKAGAVGRVWPAAVNNRPVINENRTRFHFGAGDFMRLSLAFCVPCCTAGNNTSCAIFMGEICHRDHRPKLGFNAAGDMTTP